MNNTNLLPPPTTEELVAELRKRVAANLKTADDSGGGKYNIQEKVCRRTAQELERLIAWIIGS
jgi:hypothetical protein